MKWKTYWLKKAIKNNNTVKIAEYIESTPAEEIETTYIDKCVFSLYIVMAMKELALPYIEKLIDTGKIELIFNRYHIKVRPNFMFIMNCDEWQFMMWLLGSTGGLYGSVIDYCVYAKLYDIIDMLVRECRKQLVAYEHVSGSNIIFTILNAVNKSNFDYAAKYCCSIMECVDVDDTNSNGNTLFHLAATNNSMVLARYLVKCKANINILNKNDKTPLHLAIDAGNEAMAAYLVDNGAVL